MPEGKEEKLSIRGKIRIGEEGSVDNEGEGERVESDEREFGRTGNRWRGRARKGGSGDGRGGFRGNVGEEGRSLEWGEGWAAKLAGDGGGRDERNGRSVEEMIRD